MRTSIVKFLVDNDLLPKNQYGFISGRSTLSQLLHQIEQLIREYTERLRLLQNENHSTAEATNYRQFIAQLQDINQRTSHEIKQAALVYSQAQTALLAAEQERLKHQKLVQRAADKQHKIQHIADIKALDSQSTIQFNLKNKTHQQR